MFYMVKMMLQPCVKASSLRLEKGPAPWKAGTSPLPEGLRIGQGKTGIRADPGPEDPEAAQGFLCAQAICFWQAGGYRAD